MSTLGNPVGGLELRGTGMHDAILDAMPAQVCVLDEHGTIIAVNKAWRDLAESQAVPVDKVGIGVSYLATCESICGPEQPSADAMARGLRSLLDGQVQQYSQDYECSIASRRRYFVVRASRLPGAGPPRLLLVHTDITDTRLAEQARRESEERFRTLFERIPDGLLVANVATRGILFGNEPFRRMLGYSEEELSNLNVQDLHPPEEVERVGVEFGRLLSSDVNLASSMPVRRKDGSLFLADISASRCRFDGQECAVGLFRDTTESRRMKEALKSREEIFSTIVNQAATAIALVDGANGGFVEFNSAAHLGLGYTREEFAHLTVRDIQAEHSEQEIRDNTQSARMRGGVSFDTKHRHKDGSIRDVRVSLRALRLQDRDYYAAVWEDITDQKRAEVMLRNEQERLASILDGADVGTWEWNVQTGEVVINERWAGIVGYTVEELVPISLATWERLVHPDDFRRSQHLLQLHLAGQSPRYDCEVRMRHKQGRWVWVLDRGRITSRGADGQPLWLRGVHTEITEQKQRESYREMAHRILMILSETGDLPELMQRILSVVQEVTEIEAVGVRLQEGEDFPYFSQRGFAEDFLLKENSLLHRKGDGTICRDTSGAAQLECTCGLILSGQTDPANPLFTRGGSAFTNDAASLLEIPAEADPRFHPRNQCIHEGYASVALIPIRARGRIIGILQLNDRRKDCFTRGGIGLLEDLAPNIGEALLRKRAEVALFESQERLKHLIAAAQDAIIMMDDRGGISLWNEAAVRILGYSVNEAMGQNLHRFLAPARFHEAHATAFADFQRTGEGSAVGQIWELSARRKDGTEFPVELSLSPVRIGGAWHAVGILRDITERKRLQAERESMEAQLRQQQKLESLGTLAGGVAHEINNPINGIMNYAQLIQDRLAADHPLQEFTGEILHETQRVAMIVRNLLTFAREEKQSHSPALISDIVEGTLSLIRTVMRHDHITLTVRVPGELPELKCRSQQIQQVLMNLMTNARDALNERYPGHDPNKLLRVEAAEFAKDGRRWIRLTVEDHGTGIRPEVRLRMFDPFFTTKQRDQGTGLGLSISHGIVTDHHGQMTVESEVGRFTRMHVDLPVDNGWKL